MHHREDVTAPRRARPAIRARVRARRVRRSRSRRVTGAPVDHVHRAVHAHGRARGCHGRRLVGGPVGTGRRGGIRALPALTRAVRASARLHRRVARARRGIEPASSRWRGLLRHGQHGAPRGHRPRGRPCPRPPHRVPAAGAAVLFAAKVGFRLPEPDDLLDRAVAAAQGADVGGARGGHDRRVGDRDARPCIDAPARPAGRADRARRRREPEHRRHRERRCTRRHGVGRRRGRGAGVRVRRTGARQRDSGRRARRRRAGLAGWRRPCRCGSSTTRRSTTSRARTASCATARACSWATAATTTAAFPSATPSVTVSATRRSPSANPSVGIDVYPRRITRRVGADREHGTPSRQRGAAAVRRAGVPAVRAPAQGAQGVRQGDARSRRGGGRRAHARRPLVRVLGSGPGRLGRRSCRGSGT